MTIENSPKGSINIKDLFHGLVVAIGSVVVTGLGTMLNSGVLPDLASFELLLKLGCGAGLFYISSNFLKNSNGDFKAETVDSIITDKNNTVPKMENPLAPQIKEAVSNPAI